MRLIIKGLFFPFKAMGTVRTRSAKGFIKLPHQLTLFPCEILRDDNVDCYKLVAAPIPAEERHTLAFETEHCA